MATKIKPVIKGQIRKPDKLDLKKAEKVITRVIQENKEWLKEMAAK